MTIKPYFDRLAAFEKACDLLIGNNVLKPADRRVFTRFLSGDHALRMVVCGNHVEEYVINGVVKSDSIQWLYDEILFIFVNLESKKYCELTKEEVLDRMAEYKPGKPELQCTPCYRIDLDNADWIPLKKGSPR